jgi:hypothetical protein
MDDQQERFLLAIYIATQDTRDETGRARARDIAWHLGLDIIYEKAERDLYQQTTLDLRDSGYIECVAIDERVPTDPITCGTVRLTESGLAAIKS